MACYTFDDADGDTFVDGSMYGNHGAVLGGSATAGLSGQALHLSEQTEAVVPNAASLNLGPRISVDLWVRAEAVPESNQLRTHVLYKPASYNVTLIAAGEVRCETERGTSEGGIVAVDVWTHIMCVDDGVEVTVYIDGDLAVSTPTGPPDPIDDASDLILGDDHTGMAQPFLGSIDSLRIWQIALGPSQACLAAGRDDC